MTTYTVLIEEDFASNNFSAYIPELRLNVVGDTEEETLATVQDLIAFELEKPNLKRFSSKVVIVQVEVPFAKEKDFSTAV